MAIVVTSPSRRVRERDTVHSRRISLDNILIVVYSHVTAAFKIKSSLQTIHLAVF